jgi:hypothetical protein
MVAKSNSAEGGTDGTTVTTGNSGGASGDAWGAVVINGTLTYENTAPHEGSMCYQISPTSSQQCYLHMIETSEDEMFLSAYLKMPSAPAATEDNVVFRSASAGAAGFGTRADAKFRTTDATGTALNTSTATLTANLWHRIEMHVVKGTTTSNGTIEVEVYEEDELTPIHSYSNTACNAGTAQLTNIRLGRPSATADTTNVFIDAVQWWTGADVPALFGNPWALQKIVGISATRLSASSVEIAWTDVTDAPNGYDVVRAPGTHTNDGDDRDPSDPLYDPLTISGAVVAVTADAGTPFVDTGLTPGDYTYWLVRTAP